LSVLLLVGTKFIAERNSFSTRLCFALAKFKMQKKHVCGIIGSIPSKQAHGILMNHQVLGFRVSLVNNDKTL